MLKKTALILPLALLVGLAAGCSSDSGEDSKPDVSATGSVPEQAPKDVVEDVPGHGKVSKFGAPVDLEKNMSVTADALGYQTIGGREDVALFEVKISNAGGTLLEGEQIPLIITYGADREIPEAISDKEAGIGGSFGELLPGEERTVTVGALVPRAHSTDVKVEVMDPNGGEPAVFVGAIPEQ